MSAKAKKSEWMKVNSLRIHCYSSVQRYQWYIVAMAELHNSTQKDELPKLAPITVPVNGKK